VDNKVHFFREGERILSNPEAITSLHSKEIIMEKEKIVVCLKAKSSKCCRGWTGR
jgi:hypothetical protein